MVTSKQVVDKLVDMIEGYMDDDTILNQQLLRLIDYITDEDAPWFTTDWCEDV